MSSQLPAQAPYLTVLGDDDVFDAFLVEFTGGTILASRDSRESPSTSTSVFGFEIESDGGRRRSRSNVSAAGASSRFVVTGVQICVGEESNIGEREGRGEEDKGEVADSEDEEAEDKGEVADGGEEEEKDKGEAMNRIYSVSPHSMASTENLAVLSTCPSRSATDAEHPACRDLEPATDKVETAVIDLAVTSDSFSVKRIISHTSVRRLSNATYLRRLNLSREDALHLFPRAWKTLDPASAKESRQIDSSSRKVCKRICTLGIQCPEGKQWHVILECLFTSGQRHVRLTKGWDEMCSANGVSVGNILRFDRWEQASPASSQEAIVTVSIV